MAGRIYPWEKWFSKPRVVLRRGKDYDVEQTTIVQQVRNAAAKRGIKVSVAARGDKVSVTVYRPRAGELFLGRERARA